MTRYVIATHNRGKIAELQRLLEWTGNQGQAYTNLVPRQQFPPESTVSYRENAMNKALTVSRVLPHEYVLADDSGLQLAAIPGWLGVTTGRDLADCPTPEAYDERILARLRGQRREFTMISWLVCAHDNEIAARVRAELHGLVATSQRGQYSRGFDRILIPEGSSQTLAEMPFEKRRSYLVRGRAVKALIEELGDRHDEN